MILFLLACLGTPELPRSPLLDMTRTPEAPDVLGSVEEVISAGSYQYLRVQDQWYATLDHGVSVGTRVRLNPLGLTTNYHSRRTDRHFDRLWFAAVELSQPSMP
jgi:hypothetical protein